MNEDADAHDREPMTPLYSGEMPGETFEEQMAVLREFMSLMAGKPVASDGE